MNKPVRYKVDADWGVEAHLDYALRCTPGVHGSTRVPTTDGRYVALVFMDGPKAALPIMEAVNAKIQDDDLKAVGWFIGFLTDKNTLLPHCDGLVFVFLRDCGVQRGGQAVRSTVLHELAHAAVFVHTVQTKQPYRQCTITKDNEEDFVSLVAAMSEAGLAALRGLQV